MSAIYLLTLTTWALAIGLLAYYIGTVASEITYVTLADGRREARTLPLIFRLLLPLTPNFDRLLQRPAFKASIAAAQVRLIAAGYEGLLNGREFVALKYLFTLVMSALLALVLVPTLGVNALLPWLAGTLLAWCLPLQWLRSRQKARATEIVRALPFVLDLLTLSVEAGMDFMGALQNNCQRRAMDALNEELLRVQREIQIGTTRKAALKNFSARLSIPQIRSLTTALIQADELGVSMGSILRIQASQMRRERYERAEKLAHEAPTKMLFPLLLFIFPATLIILLGPVIANVLREM